MQWHRKLKAIKHFHNGDKTQNGRQISKMAVHFMTYNYISYNLYIFSYMLNNRITWSWCLVFAHKVLFNSIHKLLSYGTLKFDHLFFVICNYWEINRQYFINPMDFRKFPRMHVIYNCIIRLRANFQTNWWMFVKVIALYLIVGNIWFVNNFHNNWMSPKIHDVFFL